jgi:predicted RND superfamily exporter protein
MILRSFNQLPRASLRHPRSTIIIVGLIVLGCLPGITRLELRTDGLALVSESAPQVITDQRVHQQFRIRDKLAIVIRSKSASSIFNPSTLALVKDLTTAFKGMPGLADGDVMSLATETGLRRRPGTLSFESLLEPSMTTTAELNQLRGDLEKLRLYTGTLVSMDGTATIILIGVPNEGVGGRVKFLSNIRRIIAKHSTPDNDVGITGAAMAEAIFGTQILKDLGVPGRFLETEVEDASQNLKEAGKRATAFEAALLLLRRIGLVPLSALVMVAVLLVCFRSLAAALVPLPGVLATLLVVLGTMGWLRVPIYLTTAVMPVLLTVISVANDIYLFAYFFNLLSKRPGTNPNLLLEETFDNLSSPVVVTSLSAVVGFLSFLASPLVPVKAFGCFAALGTLFSLLLSLSLIPAMLSLIRPSRFISHRRAGGLAFAARLGNGFEAFAQFVLRRRWWVIGATAVVMTLTPIGISRLLVQDSWTSGFPPRSAFRLLTTQVDKDFLGSHTLLVSFDATQILQMKIGQSAIRDSRISLPGKVVEEPIMIAGSSLSFRPNGPPGNAMDIRHARIAMADYDGTNVVIQVVDSTTSSNLWSGRDKIDNLSVEIPVRTQLSPKIIQQIDAFEDFIRQQTQCSVGGAIGPPDYLSTIRFIARGAGPDARGLPETAVDAGILWDYYRVLLGQDRLRQVLDESYSRSLITIFLKDANFVNTARLIARIREYESQHFTPLGIKLDFAGDVAVSQSLIRGIVSTQMQSLFWSSLGIFAVISLLSGSWLRGLYCMIPSLVAVAVKFAIMGWTGISLGVATSMFAAMTLGIGVNCAIHLLEGCDRSRQAGSSNSDSWIQALRSTGPAALINTLAVCLGFGVLMISQVPANSRLGTLLVLGLASCSLVSLALLPALLARPPRPR